MSELASVLQAESLSKTYPGVRALDGVNLCLAAGRVHALLGENGAGKSTLVRLITGNEQPTGGSILFSGEQVRWSSPREALNAGIAAVYQELTVLPEISVADNVLLGRQPTRRGLVNRRESEHRAHDALSEVGLGGLDPRTRAGELSLANQQLVEIARALARDARVVILDEPSAVLAGDKLDALHDAVRALAARGAAVVYITHRLDEVVQLADDVTVMRDGRTVSSGPANEYDAARMIRDMVGRDIDTVFPDLAPPTESAALTISGIEIAGAPQEVTIRRGEIVGVAGLVGSGRSRLLRTLAHWQPQPAWRVVVGGRPPGRSIRAAIDSGIAYVPEDRKRDGLVLEMGVAQNTTLATLRRVATAGFVSAERERDAYEHERKRLRIKAASPAQPVRQLSGGNQQKVVLAKWLRTQPRVLLLDEPTRGIDVGTKSEIYQIIRDLAASGLAVVLVSSELPEVLGLAHRVIVCRGGSPVAIAERDDLTEERVLAIALGEET